MIGIYQPGTSVLHRAPAAVKLLALLSAVLLVAVTVRTPWQLGLAAGTTMLLYVAAGINPRTALAQLRPLAWVLPFVAGFQLLFNGWHPALLATGILLINVALAALFTLTTSMTAVLELCDRALAPLRRFGIDPQRGGLLIALTIRCVPLVAGIVGDVNAARRARGVSGVRNIALALAAPAVVRAVRTADARGDALRARGVDD